MRLISRKYRADHLSRYYRRRKCHVYVNTSDVVSKTNRRSMSTSIVAKNRGLIGSRIIYRQYWTDYLSKDKDHDILYVNAVPDDMTHLKDIIKETNPKSITATVDHSEGWFKNFFAVRKIESELKDLTQNASIKAIREDAKASVLAPGRSFEVGVATYDVVASQLPSEEPWSFLSCLAQRTRRDGIVSLNVPRKYDDNLFQSAGFEILEREDTIVTLRAPWRYESTPPGHAYMLSQDSMISMLSSCPNRDKTEIGAPVASSSIKDRLASETESMETEIILAPSPTNETPTNETLSSFRNDVLNRSQQYAEIKTFEYDPLNDVLDNTTRLCVELERVSGIESASCASLAISFISMALHRPVRSDVAICANLELEPDEDSTIAYEASNLVTLKPVSNIESRIRSARCAAIPTIVLASSQRESVENLPDELRSGLFIEYCDSLEELFDLCFCEDPYFTL